MRTKFSFSEKMTDLTWIPFMSSTQNMCFANSGTHPRMIVGWPTVPGLVCGLCFWPWGMLCCMLHRVKRCPDCGLVVHTMGMGAS